MPIPNVKICEKCEFFNKVNLINLKDKLPYCENSNLFIPIYCDKLLWNDEEDSFKNRRSVIGWHNAIANTIEILPSMNIPVRCPFELEHILANEKHD